MNTSASMDGLKNQYVVYPVNWDTDPDASCERDEDCKSVRSMALDVDDDFYFYHGTACDQNENNHRSDNGNCDDDDDDNVDHVGALIGSSFLTTMQAPTETNTKNKNKNKNTKTPERISLLSQDSEITCDDWSTDSNEYVQNPIKGRDDISIKDFIGLKIRVAELESQLQLQRRPVSLERMVQEEQDRKLSHECENIGLKQMLQRVQDDLVIERHEARQVKTFLREKIKKQKTDMDGMKQKIEKLQAENRRLRQQHHSKGKSFPSSRRSSTGDMESPYPQEETEDHEDASLTKVYLPFPKRSRRYSTGEKPPNLAISYSSTPRGGARAHHVRRPSLLDVLRSKFASRSSASSLKSSGEERSRATRTTTDATPSPFEDACAWGHESWASTEEINTQTELFNQQAGARLLAEIKNDTIKHKEDDNSGTTPARSHLDPSPERPQFIRAYSEFIRTDNSKTSRPKLKRRNSFSIPECLRSRRLDESGCDEEFDVESVLWDNCDGEELDRSVATKRSTVTVAF